MLADSGMQQLIDIAVSTRRFIEPVWHDWHRARDGEIPGVASRHTCARTSLFLVKVLHREGLPAEWMSGIPRLSDEGPDLGPFGFFVDGSWQSHAWVRGGDWIVDITADQFGSAPVVVAPACDPRYGAGPRDTAIA